MQLNEWRLINPSIGLWEGQYSFPGGGISRSVILRLDTGKFLVYSPGAALLESASEQILGKNPIIFLLTPNGFHYLGIDAWKKAYPEALFFAGKGAERRLAKKTMVPRTPLEQLIKQLPTTAQILELPASRIGETWIRVEDEGQCTWIVGDAFLNIPQLPKKGMMRWFMYFNRMAPGLEMSRIYSWLAVSDAATQRTWIQHQASQDQPTCLIPCHGRSLKTSDIGLQISKLVSQRL